MSTAGNGGPSAGSQRTQFKKGNKVGPRFSKDNQPTYRPRKTIRILEEITDIPKEEICNVIRTVLFNKTTKELAEIINDENQNAFVKMCARVALNGQEDGKATDWDTLLQWAYVKRQEMRLEIDDISRMTREEKEAEAARLAEGSIIDAPKD
jgi:hypothetical protein